MILSESQEIIREERVLITQNKAGIIGANAGVDKSNMYGNSNYITIPADPDALAKKVQIDLERIIGHRLAILITDSVGRPFRCGSVGIAVGGSDIPMLEDKRGTRDLYDQTMHDTQIAWGDLLASCADLVMGQTNEAIPMVIIRGFTLNRALIDELFTHSVSLQRPKSLDLFR